MISECPLGPEQKTRIFFFPINTEGAFWIYQCHLLPSETEGMEQAVATSSNSSDETMPVVNGCVALPPVPL